MHVGTECFGQIGCNTTEGHTGTPPTPGERSPGLTESEPWSTTWHSSHGTHAEHAVLRCRGPREVFKKPSPCSPCDLFRIHAAFGNPSVRSAASSAADRRSFPERPRTTVLYSTNSYATRHGPRATKLNPPLLRKCRITLNRVSWTFPDLEIERDNANLFF